MNKKKLWYVRWLAAGKSYVNARAYESSEEDSKQKESDEDMWMTEEQILNHFHCPIVTAAVISECKANPKLSRAHPKIPNCPEAVQHYAPYKTKSMSETSKSTKRGCTVTADLDNDAATTMMARLAGARGGRTKQKAEQAAAREAKRLAALAEKDSPKGRA